MKLFLEEKEASAMYENLSRGGQACLVIDSKRFNLAVKKAVLNYPSDYNQTTLDIEFIHLLKPEPPKDKMEKSNLEIRRGRLLADAKRISGYIAELDKQIEAIENGPVSVEALVESFLANLNPLSKHKHALEINMIHTDYLKYFAKECESNDRKRTQPLIDAVKEWLEAADKSSGIPFGYNILNHALSTLEENEV